MERSKYKVIDIDNYYRKDVFKHFSEDCKCSTSITSKINVTKLVKYSKDTQTKFYINFLYILSKVLNSRDDYKMQYDYKSNKLIVYEKINPKHYIFHEDTETFTIVYSEFNEDYEAFYKNCLVDIENAKKTRNYGLDNSYENYFDASYISWISYESLNIELPDGYLYLIPIINWGKYKKENNELMMPVTVRMNHAAADGFLVARVFYLLEKEIEKL